MKTENQKTQLKPDGQALSDPAGSRFHYDSESGYIYDQREHAWITDLVEAWELLETYAELIYRKQRSEDARKSLSDAIDKLERENAVAQLDEVVSRIAKSALDDFANPPVLTPKQ